MRISDWSSDVCSSDLSSRPEFRGSSREEMIEGGSCGFCALSLDLCINCCALPLDNTIPATNEVLFWNVVGCGDDGKFLDDLIVASDEVGKFVVQSHQREACYHRFDAAVPFVEIRWNERKLPWLEIIGTFDCRFLLLGCVRGLVRAAARLLTTVVVAIRSSRRRDCVS